jgi:hypothetical protein
MSPRRVENSFKARQGAAAAICRRLETATAILERVEILIIRVFAFGSLLYVLFKIAKNH